MRVRANSTCTTEWPIRRSGALGYGWPTLKYLAIATVLVVAFLTIVTAFAPPPGGSGRPDRYATASGTPGPPQRDRGAGLAPAPVTGLAPWALSALPECFRQRAKRSGPARFARSRIPQDAVPVRGAGRLSVADCRLEVRAGRAVVVRGENRLVIPPVVRFYLAGTSLVLDRRSGGREDVRIYALTPGTVPSFEPLPAAAR